MRGRRSRTLAVRKGGTAMPRLRPLARDEAPEAARRAMDRAARAFGAPMTTAGIQARCPPILEAGRALGAAVAESGTLPAELRFLVCVRVAQIVRCPF